MNEEDFNEGLILPPLLVQLRKILDQYPDDNHILKELIQNAEDANAKEVKFLYDQHSYGRDSRFLHHPGLGKYQGPALYAFNDGTFNDDDWRGIRMLSQSVKQEEPLKVGYFGLGFKSVFHLTDMPFILSGDRLGVIDPQQSCFPSSSFAWNLRRQADTLTQLRDQTAPFLGHLGVTEETFSDGHFNGTLFRFPLRTINSKLSDTIYGPERIKRLLESFKKDAHFVLIFLMHLECVEFYERDERSATPKLTFRIQLSEECLFEVQQKRTEFMNQIRANLLPDRPLVTTYPIEIETLEVVDSQEIVQRHSFLVTNFFGGAQVSAVFRKLYRDTDLRFPPWVGTALPLDNNDLENKEGDPGENEANHPKGHVFCFLPLPIEGNTATGLPVHINGFFALEQNRKYIKWPGAFQSRQDLMDKRLLWNQCMLREALPQAYRHMILSAIHLHKNNSHMTLSVADIYHAFPDFSKVDRKWDAILPSMYAELLRHEVIHTSAAGGRWVEPRHAVFDTLDVNEPARDAILEILTAGEVNIASAPPHVIQAIKNCYRLINGKVTPSLVAQTYRKVQYNISLQWNEKIKLLKYFLKLMKYDLLDGLQLLPLGNGGFTQFCYNPRRAEKFIYIPSDLIPMELLPGLEDDLLDIEVEDDVKKMLAKGVSKGYTQLKLLDPQAFASLLPRCIPEEWVGQFRVTWKPQEMGQPPDNWLEALWTYLVRQCPSDLTPFETIPLIPLDGLANKEEIEMVPLAAAGPVLARELNGQTLPQELRELLTQLGVIVVEAIPDFIAIHPMLARRYVFSPTYIGVLRAMLRITEVHGQDYLIEKVCETTSDQSKRKLREFFNKVSEYDLTDAMRAVLACLPIFETVKMKDSSPSFVSFASVNLAAPADKLPVKLSRDILDMGVPHTSNLSHVLGVRTLNMAQLLIEIVFPDIEKAVYDSDELERLMIYVLRHYYSFVEESSDFQCALQSLTFLPRNGIYLTANRFYDPDNQLLQRVFLNEENFPTGVYGDPTIVTVLRQVGIRGDDQVESEDLREACYQVEDMALGRTEIEERKLEIKSDAIVEYIEKHTSILHEPCDSKKLWEWLKDIAWVRRLTRKPVVYPHTLPWYSANTKYNKPSDMIQKVHGNIVGGVLPVVAKDTADSVSELFGWTSSPGPVHLVQHLASAVKSFNGTEKAMYLELTRAVYTELAKHPVEEVRALLEEHNVTKWVWHGDGFTSPQQIVFHEPFMDLRPFVYTFTVELLPLSDFFGALGALETCHLPNVLKQIKEKHDSTEVGQSSLSEVKKDLHLCVTILNELKSSVTEESLCSLQDELVLPLHNESKYSLKMAPLHDCTYCDHEWMRQGYDLGSLGEEEDRLLLVHPNLPIDTSQVLGVPTLMSRMLEAEELDFSFGQTDSLTHRLNVLLQEYVDGFAVPKELVQNADDAGATCVKILYDERQNQDCRTCLIDEGMRECHGPALWAYNDAVFTDQDFDNITKLSGATKEEMTDKIGRFGLGFNAVYNLTDVPSFVSKNNIVIFDPHTTHLGNSIKNKSKPGIKIDMLKHRRKLRRLGNQFKPYNGVFGCDLSPESQQDSYRGTLFRLPLRTKTQAVKSEICQRHYDDVEVKSLLKLLMQGAESLLFFTQNVVEVSIHHIPAHGHSPSEAIQVFSIQKDAMRILKELLPAAPLPDTVHTLKQSQLTAVKQSGSLRSATKVMKDIRSGVDANNIVTPNSATIISLEQRLTEQGARLFRTKSWHKSQQWLITSFMGTGESLQMALKEETLVPLTGIAVPLQQHSTSEALMPMPIVDKARLPCGSVYSYLPLPIQSGLPVHINGTFAVTSNRRYLCEKSEEDKFDIRAIWNDLLFQDSMCQAYINMLKHLSLLAPQPEYLYHRLWPQPQHTETNCKSLLASFYKALANGRAAGSTPKLFCDGNKWVAIEDTCTFDEKLLHSGVKQEAMEVFRLCSKDMPSIVTEVPNFVREGFLMAESIQILTNNTNDISKFFQNIFLENIILAPAKSRDKLMQYAITSEVETDPDLLDAIRRSNCIPVTPDGSTLVAPALLVDPDSSLAKLYSPDDSRFPDLTYRAPEVLRSLRSLGMMSSDISWDELLHRAESISTLPQQRARSRITAVLECLESKIELETDQTIVDQMKSKFVEVAFLPLATKPIHLPLKWKGQELGYDTLVQAANAYLFEHRNLVGCIEPVVDDAVFPHHSERVKSFLGLVDKEPDLGVVLKQLEVISDKETEKHLKEKDINNEIFKVCFQVYGYLQSTCDKEDNTTVIHDNLHNQPFILCQERFLSPQQVAFEFSQNCSPYLFALPELYKRNFTELLSVVGVRHQFETPDYVMSLQGMHSIHNGNVLSRDNLKLALQLVNLLNDSMQEMNQTLTNVVNQLGKIFIPDATGALRASSELCFNEPDCQWVPTAGYVNYSHAHIPFAISKQLGVNTKRQEVLKKHSKGIPFGQRERLPVRLKRILSSYPCDKEILKELLQNADDAGATEIHFIKDPRQHGTERVFDDSWKPLQGPALCVFNNRPFTDEDMQGIQRLGEGSKGTDPNKTGQYGVGFNCVYHLTDAPSFLTNTHDSKQSLCIFDPQAKFVPGATLEEPGRRYDEVRELRNIFSDVFPCYLEDIYDLSKATMFRFPLRTSRMAADSELSDQSISLDMIDTLLSRFKHEIFDCLLFLNNITSITLTEVDKRKPALVNTYNVQVEMSEDDTRARKDFSNYLSSISEKVQKGLGSLSSIRHKSVTYTVTLKDNKGYQEKWLITQQVGFPEGTDIPSNLNDVYRRQELALLPRGGVAALLIPEESDVFDNRPKKAFCFLPLPLKTDLPVHINGHFALDHEARRNLWHDEDTGTKTEWNFLLLKRVIAPAYVTLLKVLPKLLCGGRVGANISLMAEDAQAIDTFTDMLPRFHNTDAYWMSLVKGVYRHINTYQEPVLPVVRPLGSFYSLSRSSMSSSMEETSNKLEIEWLPTGGQGSSKPFFDNLDSTIDGDELSFSSALRRRLTSTPTKKGKADILRHVLLSSGFKIIKLPLDIYECFQRADVPVEVVTPEAVTMFYRSYSTDEPACCIGTVPCDIAATPFHDVATLKTLLEYCCQHDELFFNDADRLPLLLCQDGQVRKFSKDSPVYLSPYHELLPSSTSMFTHETFARMITKDVDISSSPVFLEFSVQSFARLLPNELREYEFKLESKHVLWSVGDDKMPTVRWIWKLWTFLHETFEQLVAQQLGQVDKRSLALKLIHPLDHWCVIPALIVPKGDRAQAKQYSSPSDNCEQYLVPVGVARTVIDFTNASIMSYPVRECLRKLGVPELDRKLLNDSKKIAKLDEVTSGGRVSNFASLFVASLENPKTVLHCLKYAALTKWKMGTLRPEECFIILKYFNDSLDAWKDDMEARAILLSLPLYFTVHGDIIRLGQNEVYVLPSDIPHADMDAWEKQKGILFLRTNAALTDLYRTLNCSFLNVTEVYSKFIFKNFEYLSADARIIHLQFIKDNKLPQLKDEVRADFIKEIQSLEFLQDDRGFLQPVFYFHDPHHPVFKVLLEGKPSSFPPAPFNEFKWLAFLKSIGLKHDVNQENFLMFAKAVAQEAIDSPQDSTFNKSRALVSYLFSTQELLESKLLEELRDVKFIPAAKASKSIRRVCQVFTGLDDAEDQVPQETTKQAYISFTDGIPEGHEELVWTSSYLLPDWANPFKLNPKDLGVLINGSDAGEKFVQFQKDIAEKLGVREDPPIDLVIEHAKKVCAVKSPAHKDQGDFHAYMKMNVMKRVYRFLQSKSQESDLSRIKMKNTKCVAVDFGQTFVKPKQVVINLYEEDQIIPYLFKAPTELGEFKNLFLHLGATLNATADQYALVLENIYNATGGAKLHPNEMRSAFKAVQELFSTLEKHPGDAMFTEVLFLPSASGRLIQSTELVFNDDPSYTDRIRSFAKPFLVDLAECKIKARNYEDTIRLLPKHLRPCMLTSLVKEVLEVQCRGQGYDFGVTEKLKHQLSSKAFSNGVLRLIRHEHRRSGHKVRKSVLESIQIDLKKINVVALDRVMTHLTYEGQEIPTSASEGDCFVEKLIQEDTDETYWNIYLTNSVSMNEELLVSVADVVNKIVRGLLANSVHYLQPILSCQPHSISRVLDRLKVRPDHSIDIKTPTLPVPGSFIPIEDHHLLREEFLEFDPGEYVGYELDDDESGQQTVIYAIILEKVLEETTDEHGISVLTAKYKVCVGEDHKIATALATDLYKFHRVVRFVSRSTSQSESSFNMPNVSTSSPSTPKYRNSFYEQSSIFEPATPTANEDVFEDMPRTKPTTRKRMFGRGQSTPQQPGPETKPTSIAESESEEDEDVPDQLFGGRFKFTPRRKIKRDSKKRRQREEKYRKDVEREFQEKGFNAEDYQQKVQQPNEPTAHNGTHEDGHIFEQYTDNIEDYNPDEPDEPQGHQYVPEDQEEAESDVHYDVDQDAVPDEESSGEPQVVKIINEISDRLEEAWRLPEPQRKKIIKRLLLKWHPDKNIGNEEFSTAVTQHIHSEIERLELGLPRPGLAEDFAANHQFDMRNPFSGSSTFQNNFYNAYQKVYEQMNRRAKEHREQRKAYKDNLFREYTSNQFQSDFDVPPSFSSSNPQPAQAKRFLKQAQEDLRAADNDYDVKVPAYEWVCFKAHQAAEKALKAAQFSVDAVTSFSHDLASLAATIEDMELRRLSLKLQKIVGNSNKLYNPDPIDFVIIPHEEYSKEIACDAIMCSVDILERVKEFVELRDKD